MKKSGRVVIVTGGGSGIGKATADLFAAAGDEVYILGRRKNVLGTAASSAKGAVKVIQCDVTDIASIETAVNAITKKHKFVDVLVNCAGFTGRVEPDIGLADALMTWQELLDVNLTGSYLMIHALRSYFRRPGGRIINVSSVAAFAGSSRVAGVAYAAAKSGLHGMTRTLVKEFAPDGITINCVAPGFTVDTGFFGEPVSQERIDQALPNIPAGRTAKPVEVAHAIFYLASEEAAYVNGDILNINGGQQFGR